MARAPTARRAVTKAGNPGRLRRWFARTAAYWCLRGLPSGGMGSSPCSMRRWRWCAWRGIFPRRGKRGFANC